MKQQLNRRRFFQMAFTVAGLAAVFPNLVFAERKHEEAGKGAQLVDPNEAQAKAVSYTHSTATIKDKALQTERMGVKFKDQKCAGCAFYQAAQETKVGGKAAAPCQMPFAAGKVVAKEGWCTSWAKKA